jgi:L-fucose mutarotase/ribose pyranase (RbsD/FucU family)
MNLQYAFLSLVIVSMAVAGGCAPQGGAPAVNWQRKLQETIPLFGHRNWIVIADSAYPAQSRAAIETVVSGANQIEVVEKVLAAVGASNHLRPAIYTDQELEFVREEDAAGISAYREQLAKLLEKREVNVIEHEKIISLLDQAGQAFRVLIIKTNMKLPYTSVFIQLDCGYWSADAEQRLRKAIADKRGLK